MSQIKITEEWLYKYVPMADREMIRVLKEEVDYSYEFSPEFERKMKRLLWNEAHMWLLNFYKYMKRVAVIFLCIISLLFAITMSVDAYRDKFFQTVKEIWEDSVIYKYFTESEERGFEQREPRYMPDGYIQVQRFVTEALLNIEYQNDWGDRITWYQMLVTDGTYNVMDSEYERQETKEIHGDVAIVSIYADGSIGAYYESERYVYILTADALTPDEVYCMLESIQ